MTRGASSDGRKILVFGWEGGGNVPPTIAAIRTLVREGYDVRFLGDDCILDEARAAGARVLGWRRAPNRPNRSPSSSFARDWEEPDSISAFLAWVRAIFIGPSAAYAEDACEAAHAERTDLIIGSDLLFGGMIAAEALKIPNMLLAANISFIPLPGHPPFGMGLLPAASSEEENRHREIANEVETMFNGFLPTLNASRARFGLAPLARTLDQVRPDRLLLATVQAFDFPAKRLPNFVRYIGPILEEPGWIEASAHSSKVADDGRPLALVSFSTTYQAQEAALASVMEALTSLPMRGVITLGKAMEDQNLEAPPNIDILAGASHDEILRHAKVVVTHAGHGTTLRALRAGVPIVALPMGRDQNDNAARIAYHGAGVKLEPTASPSEIASALRHVLEEPSFTANARRLSREIITNGDGTAGLVDEAQALLRSSKADVSRIAS
jgi:MGT family glycosyltransferase